VASNLPEFVGEALGLDSDAERALQFVVPRRNHNRTGGMSREEHVRANAKLVAVAARDHRPISKLFSRGQSST